MNKRTLKATLSVALLFSGIVANAMPAAVTTGLDYAQAGATRAKNVEDNATTLARSRAKFDIIKPTERVVKATGNGFNNRVITPVTDFTKAGLGYAQAGANRLANVAVNATTAARYGFNKVATGSVELVKNNPKKSTVAAVVAVAAIYGAYKLYKTTPAEATA